MTAETPGGYFGRALLVDVGSGDTSVLPLPASVLRRTLGGSGLGTWLLSELAPSGVDPLAAEAPLAFVFSPLVGTPLTTSAKFAVVAVSPLTGLLTDALASSHFALAGKLTGHDAIVLTGRSARPVTVSIEGGRVQLEPSSEWGLSAAAAEAAVRGRLGAGWQVASIGPAGEQGVRFATLSHDGRHAGRGGLGAVMGGKRVKALAVRATTKVPPADPAGVLAAARDLRVRSQGRATQKYRELGTMANVLAFNALSTLPTRNFQQATFEHAPALATDELQRHHEVVKSSCASCTIGCAHAYRRPGGRSVRMEYQSTSSLGSMCGVGDADDVLAATARCDELGVDTISAGGTIAWAMECVGAGLLDAPWLRFGSGAAVLRALDEIEQRTDLGQLLSLGSRAAGALLGPDAAARACHVKGLELPGYEPRTMQAMALGMAVNPRGADHNRSGAYDSDLSGEHDRFVGGPAHVAAVVEAEDRAAAMDSMILCRFLGGVFDEPWSEWADLLNLVTGWQLDAAELQRVAAGIVVAKRAFNLRQGWQGSDDWLPARFLSEELTLASGRVAALTPARLRTLVDAYWSARGLDEQGRPVEPGASDGGEGRPDG